MSGLFEHDFPHTPIGTVQATGKPVSLYIHNFFRYDDEGRHYVIDAQTGAAYFHALTAPSKGLVWFEESARTSRRRRN